MGIALGAMAALWSFALAGLLVSRGLTQEVSLSAFGCHLLATVFFALGCLFAYWTYACATLRYELDRNGLAIKWGFIRQIVPLDKIEKLETAYSEAVPKLEGLAWPGHQVGRSHIERFGDILFYATHRNPEELVYVVTAQQTYAVSLSERQEFVAEVEARRKEGPKIALRQRPRRSFLVGQPIWSDRTAHGLALAGIAVWAATLGLVFARYPGLPDSLAMSFPPLEVTRVASKSELLSLPTTALGVLAVNLVLAFAFHAWERIVSHLLLVALVGVQAVFLVGAAIAVS
ncbi:MAG: PH domain-containing protein [Dehalococcoidia bacterium]|nr:PH domain-containing protein [Dehalococcoidia bacterium]